MSARGQRGDGHRIIHLLMHLIQLQRAESVMVYFIYVCFVYIIYLCVCERDSDVLCVKLIRRGEKTAVWTSLQYVQLTHTHTRVSMSSVCRCGQAPASSARENK